MSLSNFWGLIHLLSVDDVLGGCQWTVAVVTAEAHVCETWTTVENIVNYSELAEVIAERLFGCCCLQMTDVDSEALRIGKIACSSAVLEFSGRLYNRPAFTTFRATATGTVFVLTVLERCAD